MCGIAGIIRFDRPAQESELPLRAMLRSLRHRGPDGAGYYFGCQAALGNSRLSFLDKTRGSQPMVSADGRYAITYNGEVYNFRALRRELAAQWTFLTECDTEVVLAACAIWGAGGVQRLNGMFAFFFWDNEQRCGFAARDRLGIKPLAYTGDGTSFSFASEAKSLIGIRPGRPKPNVLAVLEYLVAPYFSGVSDSMFDGIQYLAPGELLRVSAGGMHLERWWDYACHQELRRDKHELEFELRSALRTAVEGTLNTPEPVGVFLSGGLDSTLIAALAARSSLPPRRAFTIQFSDQARFDYDRSLIVKSDDTPFAIEAAAGLKIPHQLVQVRRAHLLKDLQMLAQIDDALPAWEQELAQHYLARAACRSCKAVLVGDAADETHYGYSFLLDEAAVRSPAGILNRFGAAPVRRDLLESPIKFFDERYRGVAGAAGHDWETPLNRLLATTYLIVKRWLPRLLHNGDIHTMAYSLEARVPFGDIDLIELARTVHPALGVTCDGEKLLLRQAAAGLMPEPNRLRRKSALPKDQWTAEVYQTAVREVLNENGAFLGAFLDVKPIHELSMPGRRITETERALLFRVLALHYWSQIYHVQMP
ncbi:MAG: asparagine synthase (glutamine-hydrolyzing) [Verrucomicrobiota bacterium]|jgi:asparagine synthase (glutamine-hydrolysing)